VMVLTALDAGWVASVLVVVVFVSVVVFRGIGFHGERSLPPLLLYYKDAKRLKTCNCVLSGENAEL